MRAAVGSGGTWILHAVLAAALGGCAGAPPEVEDAHRRGILTSATAGRSVPDTVAGAAVPAALGQSPAFRIPIKLGGGIGFTIDPGTFLLGLESAYSINRNVTVGPLVQLGLEDDTFLLAPTVNFKGVFDLGLPGPLDRIRPFVQGGPGFVFLDRDRRREGDDDEANFMLNFGGGIDVHVTDQLSLLSSMLFNFMPVDVVDENFFFSWQLATLGWSF